MSIVDTKSNLSECLLSLMLMSFLLTSELSYVLFMSFNPFMLRPLSSFTCLFTTTVMNEGVITKMVVFM